MIKNSKNTGRAQWKETAGFTLMELMFTVAIVGLLSVVAYPSYSDFVVRSDRAEAPRELVRLANLQEQLFVDSRAYTTNISDLGVGTTAIYETPSHNYKISATVVDNTFTLTANAQGSQKSKDTDCITIEITDTGKKTPIGCWEG